MTWRQPCPGNGARGAFLLCGAVAARRRFPLPGLPAGLLNWLRCPCGQWWLLGQEASTCEQGALPLEMLSLLLCFLFLWQQIRKLIGGDLVTGRCFQYDCVSPLRPTRREQSCWLGGIVPPYLESRVVPARCESGPGPAPLLRNAGRFSCSLQHGPAFPIRSGRSGICFCVLDNLQGMRQVICLWIECSPFTSGMTGQGVLSLF